MLWGLVTCSLLLIKASISSCPRYCSCKEQYIDCSSKQLTTLSKELLLQFFQIGGLQNRFLNNKLKITDLNLSNNQLKDLSSTLISESLPNLVSLDLSKNRITDISNIQSVVLSRYLLYFKLSLNPIHNLGNDTDSVLYSQSISHLDISNCNINSITYSGSFTFMLNLTHLDLSGNPLIVVDHFVSNTLEHLDLSYCLLGFTDKGIRDEALVDLPNLKFLNISRNSYLTRLPSSKVLSYSLMYLDTSYCSLEKLDLRSMPNLHQATIKGNIIKTLTDNSLSQNINLQSMDLSENVIYHIEQLAFVGCKSLITLDLSKNLLSSVDWNMLRETPQLSILNVSRNLLTTLYELPTSSLTTIDASKCEISQVNYHFLEKAVNMKYLNLSYNSLEHVPKGLTASKLLSLDLSFCRISNFEDESNTEPSKLNYLNLMGNRLTSPFRQSLINHLSEIKELNLLNNPWHCDCGDPEFEILWKYLLFYPPKSKYTKNLLCQSPKEHAGLTWEKSCFENVTNNEELISKHKTIFSLLVPLLVLSCLLAVLFIIRKAYFSHQLEIQQRDLGSRRSNSVEYRTSHYLDNDLERGIQMSINESLQRENIRELSKLPSYEEALLLPKPHSREDLHKIVKKYEETDRFQSPLREEGSVAPQLAPLCDRSRENSEILPGTSTQ